MPLFPNEVTVSASGGWVFSISFWGHSFAHQSHYLSNERFTSRILGPEGGGGSAWSGSEHPRLSCHPTSNILGRISPGQAGGLLPGRPASLGSAPQPGVGGTEAAKDAAAWSSAGGAGCCPHAGPGSHPGAAFEVGEELSHRRDRAGQGDPGGLCSPHRHLFKENRWGNT